MEMGVHTIITSLCPGHHLTPLWGCVALCREADRLKVSESQASMDKFPGDNECLGNLGASGILLKVVQGARADTLNFEPTPISAI